MLALLLATLVHVLACAHGPTATAADRTGTLPYASTASAEAATGTRPSLQAPAASSLDAGPAGHGGGHHCCSGAGEPALQSPRHRDPAAPPLPALARNEHPGGPRGRGPAHRRGSPLSAEAPSDGPPRALLGIWRS
ncbi:hypothetical protein [Streptomyces sp. NK08204]|uniref:hypothetical protein n=1 Tax=Streptomyces sp. NK08204 TaxID=2873260 RepID=UPI001CED01D3|nr:hypothetical protein [Streptomyces sp. NK08204]